MTYVKLASSVRKALSTLGTPGIDTAAAELALAYARAVDNGGDLEKIGPLLLNVLESMLMTPKARAAVVKGARDDTSRKSPLDELRARRDARNRDTATVDPAAS